MDDYQGKLASDRKLYEVAPRSFEDLSQHSVFSPSVPRWILSCFKRGEFSRTAMHFLVGHLLEGSKIWKYILVVEDIMKESAWKVTDSILLYAIGALISSCYDSGSIPGIVVVSRKSLLCELEDNEISLSLKEKHFDVLKSHNLCTIPDMLNIERRNILLSVFHCKKISVELENVPEGLKLVVVASRCWLWAVRSSVDHRFKAFILALVLCLQKCLSTDRDEVQHRPKNRMKALDRIHYLAQWECMLHLANTFNQILGCPFTYTSLGRMFSATVFRKFFVNLPDPLHSMLDEDGTNNYVYSNNKEASPRCTSRTCSPSPSCSNTTIDSYSKQI